MENQQVGAAALHLRAVQPGHDVIGWSAASSSVHVGLIWMVDRQMTKAQQMVRQLFRNVREELLAG